MNNISLEINEINENNKNEICIIIQGPINYQWLCEIKKKYKNCNIPMIFSTWKGEENKFSKNDITLFNTIPMIKGKQNVMLQQLSTYNGILLAKDLGYKYAIKIRSDMIFTDINKFLELDIDYDKLNFLFFLDYYRKEHNKQYKYFCDYIQISSINNLLKLWNFDYNDDCKYPEELITKNVFKEFQIENISFFGSKLSETNNIYWFKNNLFLNKLSLENSYKTNISF